MRISRTVAYAIFATLQLARESANVPVSCSHLARVGQLPKRFLLQILRRLVTHGVLQSTRGADGGYYLSRPAEQITLRDIVDAFERPSDVDLPAIPGFATNARARVIAVWNDMSDVARAELSKLTVADLVRPSGGSSMGE